MFIHFHHTLQRRDRYRITFQIINLFTNLFTISYKKIPYFYRELLNCTCVRRFGAKIFVLCISYLFTVGIRQPFRDGPLENVWGQGGGDIRQKGNKTEKIQAARTPPPSPPPTTAILMLRMRWDSDSSIILPLYHWRRIIFFNTLPKRAPEDEQKWNK